LGEQHGPFSRAQVVAAERRATNARRDRLGGKYVYDGINFWRVSKRTRLLIFGRWVPKNDWWHREGCRCELCDPARLR
jgi:hypothetical protein